MKFILFLACFAACFCAKAITEPPLSSKIKKLEELFSPFNQGTGPGIAASVILGRKIVFESGWGYRNILERTKNDAHTRFELASVSKQITAMGILLLQERGQLSLDEKITKFIPELGDFASGITIRELLHHTGGLPDYTNLCSKGKEVYNSDIIAFLAQKKWVDFPHGEKFEYSNTGYSLLASIIEKVSQLSYPKFLKKQVFDPAGMSETFVNQSTLPFFDNTATSYTRWPFFKVVDEPRITNCNTVYGDGSIYSNVHDMALWNLALDENKLVPVTTYAEAFKPGTTKDGKAIGYGFGWRMDSINQRQVFSHGGVWAGFTNLVARLPKEDFKVILLSNSKSTPTREILESIVQLFFENERSEKGRSHFL